MSKTEAAAAPYEHIEQIALEQFALNGVRATSIRDIAKAAGVSVGLIQHYFPSKEALRDSVSRRAIAAAQAALVVHEIEGDAVADIAERITALVADHFLELRYAARGVAEGDPAALSIFASLVQLCRDQLQAFQKRGLLRDGLDLQWAALHTVMINLATVMFEPGISQELRRPFLSGKQVERWKKATTELFARGELR